MCGRNCKSIVNPIKKPLYLKDLSGFFVFFVLIALLPNSPGSKPWEQQAGMLPGACVAQSYSAGIKPPRCH